LYIYNLSEIFKNKSNCGGMERTWKEMDETIVSENDLMSLIKSHNVSVYRKENFKNYDSITYRCSQYRTFTKCQYQLKAKVYHDGIYQIFYSQHHEYDELLEDTRLPTDLYYTLLNNKYNSSKISLCHTGFYLYIYT
jgi:hypothetical protein